jgi:hypothetical protein
MGSVWPLHSRPFKSCPSMTHARGHAIGSALCFVVCFMLVSACCRPDRSLGCRPNDAATNANANRRRRAALPKRTKAKSRLLRSRRPRERKPERVTADAELKGTKATAHALKSDSARVADQTPSNALRRPLSPSPLHCTASLNAERSSDAELCVVQKTAKRPLTSCRRIAKRRSAKPMTRLRTLLRVPTHRRTTAQTQRPVLPAVWSSTRGTCRCTACLRLRGRKSPLRAFAAEIAGCALLCPGLCPQS